MEWLYFVARVAIGAWSIAVKREPQTSTIADAIGIAIGILSGFVASVLFRARITLSISDGSGSSEFTFHPPLGLTISLVRLGLFSGRLSVDFAGYSPEIDL